MRRSIGVQVQEKRRIMHETRRNFLRKSVNVEIHADNGKRYRACIIEQQTKVPFVYRVVEISVKTNKIVTPRRHARIYCTLGSVNRSISDLIGAEVYIREKNNPKTIKGKIVSAHPYIIGTPPGGNPLPPIDE